MESSRRKSRKSNDAKLIASYGLECVNWCEEGVDLEDCVLVHVDFDVRVCMWQCAHVLV